MISCKRSHTHLAAENLYSSQAVIRQNQHSQTDGWFPARNRVLEERTSGASRNGEHYAFHHDAAETQSQRDEECGGDRTGANVSGLQLHSWPTTEAAICRQTRDLEQRLDGARIEFASNPIDGYRFGGGQELSVQYGRGKAETVNAGQPSAQDEIAVMTGQMDNTGGQGWSYNYYRILKLTIPPAKK